MGLAVQIEGNNVNVTVPQMTKEIREGAVKQAKKYADMTKDNIRLVRGDVHKFLKSQKDKIPKDQFFKFETELQNVTDMFCKKVDETFAKKEKEILNI